MARERQVRGHLVELEVLNARGLVFKPCDDAGLDGVVNLVIGNRRRGRCQRLEDLRLDRRAHDPHLVSLQIIKGHDRVFGQQIARAPASVAHDLDIGFLQQLVLQRRKHIAGQDRIPVVQIAEQERHIHQRDGRGELGHIGRRKDRIVDRHTLVQEGDVIAFDAKLAVQT